MNSEYWWNSGTSMAAPHVAGAVALLQALSQDLSWNLSMQDIINRVLDSARPAQSMVGITKTGGILNAYNAIAGVYPEPIDPPNVPGTPTGFAVADGADGTARLSWDSDPDATHYVVEREKKREKGKNKGTWGSSWSYDVSGTTYTDPTDPGEFRYRISAGNASGTSDPTTPWLEVMVTNGGSGGGDDGPKKCHPRRGGC